MAAGWFSVGYSLSVFRLVNLYMKNKINFFPKPSPNFWSSGNPSGFRNFETPPGEVLQNRPPTKCSKGLVDGFLFNLVVCWRSVGFRSDID